MTFLEEAPSDLKSDKWQEIGFQGLNPRTDFRGGGYLSLQCLVYFTKYNPEHFNVQKQRIKDHQDWFLAICCINITSYLVSYLHMSKGNSPISHNRIMAGRRAFKNFCRINQGDKKTFYEIQAQALMYLYTKWVIAIGTQKGKLPPHFQGLIDSTIDCIDRVLRRRDIRRRVDIRIAFDAEI